MSRPTPFVDDDFLAHKVEEAAVEIDPTLNFSHRALQRAKEYWQVRRANRAMPAREDLSTSDMRPFITHVTIVRVDGPADPASEYTIRIAGAEVEKVFGPISGKQLRSALPADAAARWRYCYEMVRNERRPLRFCGHIRFQDKRWLIGETFVAPLGGEKVTGLFGAFACWHDMAQKPR